MVDLNTAAETTEAKNVQSTFAKLDEWTTAAGSFAMTQDAQLDLDEALPTPVKSIEKTAAV